jgi:hypothetical protein
VQVDGLAVVLRVLPHICQYGLYQRRTHLLAPVLPAHSKPFEFNAFVGKAPTGRSGRFAIGVSQEVPGDGFVPVIFLLSWHALFVYEYLPADAEGNLLVRWISNTPYFDHEALGKD